MLFALAPYIMSLLNPAPAAPKYIHDRVNDLGRSFNGRVGIAVRSIDDGWATGWKAEVPFDLPSP